MARIKRALLSAAVVVAAATSGTWMMAAPAHAYGGGATHNMWQVGLSFNCNNPSFCGSDLGGFWGWAELDSSPDGTQTWGDAEFAGCGHTLGGGGAGAGHVSQDITSWYIAPGSAGPDTFYVSGVETDRFAGHTQTFPFTNMDSGVSADPGHYTASDIFGFTPPHGVAVQVQVAYRPAK